MKLFGFEIKNPIKARSPGKRTATPTHQHEKTLEALEILRQNPYIDDRSLAKALGLTGGFAKPFIEKAQQILHKERLMSNPLPQAPNQQPPPDPGSSGSGVKEIQMGAISLITYSPEQLLLQVEQKRASVSFGLSRTAKFMEWFNQVWSWAGPVLFCLGTIGEIFLVLWERQRVQDLFTGFTIVAVSMIAEGTLLAISFSSKRLRNRADKRASGWLEKERNKLTLLKYYWFALALGVGATQVAFVVAQTHDDGIGATGVWAIAIVRAITALVADAYTAFVSEEKPTTGEQAIEEEDQQILFTEKLLKTKVLEVTTLNAGAIEVQNVGLKAEIAQDTLNTQKEIARLQNKEQIDNMLAKQKQDQLFARMQTTAMRAIFDPEMDEDERATTITMLSGFAQATRKQLPPQHPDTNIVDEDDDE